MDTADKRQQAQAANLETNPSGKSVAWRNPDSGNNGTVTPVRTRINRPAAGAAVNTSRP
jgi:surface antigen